jgi:hypothetical protein
MIIDTDGNILYLSKDEEQTYDSVKAKTMI